MRYNLVSDGDTASITVYQDGEVYTATNTHPNYAEIVAQVLDGSVDPTLFDVSVGVAQKFDRLSDRVTVAGGHVYFDGDEVHNALTNQIVRFLNEGHDFMPLVRFMEKLATNPNEHSREQLYEWLVRYDFTIDNDGDVIAYKGVGRDAEGNLVSTTAGPGIVNGEAMNGRLPNNPGTVVEMPRSQVNHDPSKGCSTGLHVANWDYASKWDIVTVKVKVNPRDIVSVPTDCGWQKVRCCRYEVVEVVTEPVNSALDLNYDDEDYEYVDEFEVSYGDDEPDEEAIADAQDALSRMTLRQLRTLAQSARIRVNGKRPSYCNKAELLAALTAR